MPVSPEYVEREVEKDRSKVEGLINHLGSKKLIEIRAEESFLT